MLSMPDNFLENNNLRECVRACVRVRVYRALFSDKLANSTRTSNLFRLSSLKRVG